MRSGLGLPARVFVRTLGCPKNEADSRAIARRLQLAGVSVVDDPEQCTHVLVNTCGFIQDAKEESIGAILDACAHYPDREVLVMGCLVERYSAELAEGIPEVAGWFGLAGTDLEERLRQALAGGKPSLPSRPARSPHSWGGHEGAYAYLKISDGCDEPCTFCAIPGIKGPYHSVPVAEIIEEAGACLAEGARELVLVGQDTSRWTGDGLDLAGLVDLVGQDERCRWIRVMYLQPDGVTDSFLRYMASAPKLCRYLDVPFQHSHPAMLRAMARGGDGGTYLELMERARRLMPDVSIRSTFIVGFPGEVERHFEHLLDFVDRAGFDYAGGFVYSPEEGTAAAGLKPRVARSKALDRLNRLNSVLAERAERGHQKLVGHRVEVMIDEVCLDDDQEGHTAVGRTRGQAPEVDGVTYMEGPVPPGVLPGDIVTVTVQAAVGYDLVGTCDAA